MIAFRLRHFNVVSLAGIVLCLLVLGCSCSEADNTPKKDLLTFEAIPAEEVPPWQNLIPYTTSNERLKNLAFNFLEHDSIHPKELELMGILKEIVEANPPSLVQKLKALYEAEEIEVFKDIYSQIVEHLLVNEGAYKEFVQFLKSEESSFIEVLSTFPQEEFEAVDVSYSDYLRRGYYKHSIIKGSIAGNDTEMVFDTGADWTLLSESRAREYGAIQSDEEFDLGTSTNQSLKARFGYVKELRIGNVLIKNHHVLIVDDEYAIIENDSASLDLNVVLGWNAIRKLHIEFDDVEKRFLARLPRPDATLHKNMYWLGSPMVKVVADNGQSMSFGIDTGSAGTEIDNNFVEKFPDIPFRTDTTDVGGLAGVEEWLVQVADSVSLYLSNYRITFPELKTTAHASPFFIFQDGIFGNDILQQNKMVIDYPNRHFGIQ